MADENKDRKSHDYEADDVVDEKAVIDSWGARFLGLVEGLVAMAAQVDVEVGKIDLAEHQADRRHDDVFDERVYDFTKCSADDYADSKVDYVAARDEFPEVFEHGVDNNVYISRWR